MIFVGGIPLSTDPSSSQESDALVFLMEHPILVAASNSFNAILERKFSVSEESNLERSTSKCVYVFQREYATVDPALVDVHLVGAFEDASPQSVNRGTKFRNHTKLDGYSFSLCTKIIETLQNSNVNFHIQTLHVLGHNTKWDSQGNAFPIFHGFLVEPSIGSIVPASFDITSRCPDEIVRRIRLTASFEDPICTERLLETYDTQTDQIIISPFSWTKRRLSFAFTLRHLSDTEILLSCSTSPSAEGPDFVDNQRRQCEYLITHPDWRKTFPSKQPRVFERTSGGGWRKR